MHAQAKLDGHDAGQLLLYVPAVDRPAARLAKSDFDEMRAEPNIRASAKLPVICRSVTSSSGLEIFVELRGLSDLCSATALHYGSLWTTLEVGR